MMKANPTAAEFSRREILRLALASPLLAVASGIRAAQPPETTQLNRQAFVNAPSRVVPVSDSPAIKQVELIRQWQGLFCRAQLINRGRESVRIKGVVLFDVALSLPAETQLYGEGFQMLSQTGGTISKPADL